MHEVGLVITCGTAIVGRVRLITTGVLTVVATLLVLLTDHLVKDIGIE